MTKVTKTGLVRRASYFAARGRNALANLVASGSVRGYQSKHCADFNEYVSRLGGRQNSGFPDHWRVDDSLVNEDPARVAVVIHCFYPELMEELFEHLRVIPVDFDLFITNASQHELTVPREQLPRLGHVSIVEVANHGRDIFPTVQLINAGFLDPYDIVLKVHTKRSPWREDHADLAGDGAGWKDQLLGDLLGSEQRAKEILNAFASDSSLGLVTADDCVVGPDFWGGDQHIVEQLLRRLELSLDDPDALRFASGSMYWIRGFLLQGLRALNLQHADFDEENGQVDATTAHAVERLLGILTEEAGLRMAEVAELGKQDTSASDVYLRFERGTGRYARAQVIPFYLPQFHDSPQNNRWWGQGFTEWSNVTAAIPGYRGHYQPKLPTELGFYDLANDEVRRKQAVLAREHGIAGFMYYYYWFSGERLLNVPIERLHASDLDQPYCIMWANENWTRRWDGRAADILVGQDYTKVPAETFIDDVMEFLLDSRYMRIDGKAVLAVYRPAQMTNFPDVVATWRQKAREAGVGELYVLAVAVAEEFDGIQALGGETGIDGTLQFPPHNLPWVAGPATEVGLDSRWRGNFMSYQETVKASLAMSGTLDDSEYPGAMVAFDNTARRQWTADTWYGSNPYTFRRWVAGLIDSVMSREPEHRVVFINAWNEWAESAVLEPTTRFGRTFLLALRDAVWI
ncbi:glycoside hydrolase family 99-like domain-containing protein [Actinomyces ruminis]|uniref:Glycosyl transferase family 2 n=1 Tax=Actinomyces ruminis TaxID=1937003 RepID=A0ABX4MAX6_9ACTO|nr:glycoside hydrolase family 99-like domain-containing protein [Actinomyces ruminis]PHP52406.1 glycosyl transferase family 2 [Actinomyces ruminis]